MAFPTGWGRYCPVVIDADQVSGTSHSDFPVLVTEDMLPSEMFDADGSYPALNGGGDIRFTTDTAGSNGLHCEVVSFVTDNNPANGTAEIWVKVPTLSGSADTTIYVWYNATGESQPAASDATFGSQGVWSDYKIVSHLDSSTEDSTGNGSWTDTDATDTTGKIGGAQDFNGTTAHLDYSTTGWTGTEIKNSGITLQAWAKFDSLPGDDSIKSVFGGLNSGGNLSFASGGIHVLSGLSYAQPRAVIYDGSYKYLGPAYGISASTWVCFHATINPPSSEYDLFLNGSSVATASISSSATYLSAASVAVGALPKTTTVQFHDGQIDEVRARVGVLSDEWIATEYANQNSPATFAAAGTPVSAGGGGVSAELTGNSSTAAVGTLGVATEGSVSVTPSGVSATSAVGTLGATAEINASAELTGVSSSGAVGAITAEVGGGTTANLAGNESAASVGTLGVSTEVNAFVDLLGNSVTGAVGTLIVVTGLQVALSGNAATGAVGTLGVTAEINASATLTGVGSSGAVGTLEVTVPIATSVELTGTSATGVIGSLTAVGAGQVWTEIPPVSTTWTEIS